MNDATGARHLVRYQELPITREMATQRSTERLRQIKDAAKLRLMLDVPRQTGCPEERLDVMTDKRKKLQPAFALLALLTASFMGGMANAAEPEVDTDLFAIARGGQYYDKWWAVIDADEPKEKHPAYPAAGKQNGSATWRCKECHGWDYLGAQGAYKSGSHFTGIKGLTGMAGADPAAIAKAIRGAPHGFTQELLSDRAVERLALFVRSGQIDMDKYIDRQTKAARGDPGRGARFFQTVCANCHGFDGKELNFGSNEKPEFVGTVATENPWETLHKIRYGQPGQVMPALVALELQDLVDILAYSQTLPVK